MATVMPPSELLRRAVAWVDEQILSRPHTSLSTLIDEAGMRFNLGPIDTQWLENMLKDRPDLIN